MGHYCDSPEIEYFIALCSSSIGLLAGPYHIVKFMVWVGLTTRKLV